MAQQKTDRSTSGGEGWTPETLAERRTLIRWFEINLPALLPRADWPRPPEPNAEPDESDLLFERLFLLESWPPAGFSGSPPEFPLILLGDTRLPDNDHARRFTDALLWGITFRLGDADLDLLDGFPDIGIKGFGEFRCELAGYKFSALTDYRVCLAARHAIRQLDSTVFTLDRVSSLKRRHSGARAPKRAGFDRLARTARLVEQFKELWGLDSGALEEVREGTPRSGTMLDTHGLPDDMLWVRPSIRQLALAMLAVRPEDVDPDLARRELEQSLVLMQEEHRDATEGHFDPHDAQTRDPAALSIIKALDRTLSPDLPNPGRRAEFIAQFLNALYPKGFRSRQNPLGPRRPDSRWIAGDVRRVAQAEPRRPRVEEGSTQAEEILREIHEGSDSNR